MDSKDIIKVYSKDRGQSSHQHETRSGLGPRKKKCFICGKPGCWSTNHSLEERKSGFSRFQQQSYFQGEPVTPEYFQAFLAEWEGVEGFTSIKDDVDQFLENWENGFDDYEYKGEQFLTEYGPVDPYRVIKYLNNQSTFHAVTRKDIFKTLEDNKLSSFSLELSNSVWQQDNEFSSRYSEFKFQGIIPDTGAAGVSTAGHPQLRALQKQIPSLQIDENRAGEYQIRFGKGEAISLGTVEVNTPIGKIVFHVVPLHTPFLLCFQVMKQMGVYLNNLKNVLVQGKNIVPIVIKFGHPFLLLDQTEETIAFSHLTETELRRLHRRFGHPSVQRLISVLHQAGHDVDNKAVERLTHFCRQCQLHGKAPGRFKFKLPKEYDFNHTVIVDIVNLGGDNTLHIVDESTSYQAGRFLTDMSTVTVWNAFRASWIDTYLGPPDFVSHDAGTNFASREFRQNAHIMGIQVHEVPVEAHQSIGKVERYHVPLRRAYQIICAELKGQGIPKEIKLQMAFKALNDSVGPNGLIPTLLVYGAYPRMNHDSPPSPSITARAQAMEKAMKEIHKIRAEQSINSALATRNGPNTLPILNHPIQGDVVVWREKKGWCGPYKLMGINTIHQECTLEMPYGLTRFRATVVKPFHKEENVQDSQEHKIDYDSELEQEQESSNTSREYNPSNDSDEQIIRNPPTSAKRRRGRPKGSGNRQKNTQYAQFEEVFYENLTEGDCSTLCNNNSVYYKEFFLSNKETASTDSIDIENFLTTKEDSDLKLSLELRNSGVITSPGQPFEASDQIELDSLIKNNVIKLVKYDESKHGHLRLFNSRFVREVKGKGTDKPYEKSRLVIAAWGDMGKTEILTQSPTLQRASQRLIAALAPSLFTFKEKKIGLCLRDISQAYMQSKSKLNRLFCARLPTSFKISYAKDTIIEVLKPLYGIPEAGTHWWVTYMSHHKQELQMESSTYDPCLLITRENVFGIVGMQTDDTLILGESDFSKLEEEKLKFVAKPKEQLTPVTPIIFNGCILSFDDDKMTIHMRQKGQGKKINLIDLSLANSSIQKSDSNLNIKQKYICQRARGAYIASICQPEACFDLSSAAQVQNPSKADIERLNKRLQWQKYNLDRGLRNIVLSLDTAKIFVFVDASFANNADLSSQTGFVIILANENDEENGSFTIKGNIVHYSSTKSKRITRSVLASEIYGMVAGVDMAYALNTTLKMIMNQLNLPPLPTIVCTDSYSLYECLVKLGITKEKRLMIDIMALRQSYERRELFEIRWINGSDNPCQDSDRQT